MGLEARTVNFNYKQDFRSAWHPRLPEFACAANAVSLLMPYAEPFVARTVRSQLSHLPRELRDDAEAYAKQELAHQAQHRQLNRLVGAEHPGVRWTERAASRVFSSLENRASLGFNLAFAAGFEGLAYTGARWTERQLGALLDGSDDVPATMFLWHLAEEVEHKSVAYDVFEYRCGRRMTLLAGTISALVVIAVLTMMGTVTLLAGQRRLHSPRSHARLAWWSVTFAFDLLPALAVSVLPSHHPNDLVDPPWFAQWLACFDPRTQTMPLWNSRPSMLLPEMVEAL